VEQNRSIPGVKSTHFMFFGVACPLEQIPSACWSTQNSHNVIEASHSVFWSGLKSLLILAFATCCLIRIVACSQLAGLLYPSADSARIFLLFALKRQRNSSLTSLYISNSAISFLSRA